MKYQKLIDAVLVGQQLHENPNITDQFSKVAKTRNVRAATITANCTTVHRITANDFKKLVIDHDLLKHLDDALKNYIKMYRQFNK